MGQEEDDAENALVAELRALAGSPEGDRFVVSRNGRSIRVTHNSGSSSSLTLRASYDAVARAHPSALVAARPLAIVLRSDTPAHGIPTAYRTGDGRFDAAVFVDTPTTNREVLAAVLGPEARAAVLGLFAVGFHRVTIDDANPLDGSDVVEAYLWTFASSEPPRERAAQCLDAFTKLLDHLPKVTSSGEAPAEPKAPAWVRVSGFIGLIGVLAMVPAWILVGRVTGTQDDAPQSIALLASLACGLVAWWITRSTLIRQLGMPQTGSFLRVVSARIKVFFGVAAIVFLTAMLGVLLAHR